MRFSISNKSFNKFAGVAAALMILPVAVACDSQVADTTESIEPVDTEMPADTAETTEGETIVDVAAANGSFDTLVAAVQAAGLAETLSSEGPFTVFAPTDEAFEALPEGALDSLLEPENQEVLSQILTYHVVPAEVPSSEIAPGAVATVEGEEVDIAVDGDTVSVNDATVVTADVMASNGVIHVIDSVLVPPTVDLSAL
ncbi:fasciclin domain-containing protein [cf. Phormidesmis sp. LEGE 11477]|uniref:fasciclin domain-containing protein n=1 Tax=cf. Phormidesmis sp. LEGE 11477 TaxID=1828680 RepID=UPI001D14A0CC|nr:fasciclin domain-containing protein [cf. Phormidesmis sp. LEGE 11477]